MKRSILLFLLLTIFFTGCASQVFFDVLADEDEVDYYQGREVVSRRDENAKTILNFERQEGGHFVYYLHIENTSDETYDIQPEQIYMEVINYTSTEKSRKVIIYNYAIDPERELEAIYGDMEDLEDSHTAGTATNCLFGLFSVVHDISNDEDEADIGYDWAGNLINDQADYENNKAELYASKEFWQNEVLRITTLNPGEKIGGLIYLPITKEATEFTIVVPVNETEHIYYFKQAIKK